MKLLFICFFSLSAAFVNAQNGEVEIIKDIRVDALIEKQGEIIPPASNSQITGYRIQIFFDSDKVKLNSSRGLFISRFPLIDTYTKYNAPNFFLKVGDFRTRLEAEKIKAEIEADFPTSFVVKEKVNLPRLEKE